VRPLLASWTARPNEVAATQLHDEIVDVSANQVLNGKRTELAAYWLQDVLVARGGGRPDLVAGAQPVSARLFHGQS
jgi:non-ribosomal peptide synthetase component F